MRPSPCSRPSPGSVLSRRILRLGRRPRALAALQPGAQPPLERARFNVMLGQALGEAAGAIAFRVAPPRRPRCSSRLTRHG